MQTTIESPLLVKSREAARLLSISARKLRQLTNARELPSVKIGASVRYSLADLNRFIEARTTKCDRASAIGEPARRVVVPR